MSQPVQKHPVATFYIQNLMWGRLRGKRTENKKALANTRA